jgi:type I restriction enzyme M protein
VTAGAKTTPLFLTKIDKATERVWCYDLSDIKTGNTRPFLMAHMDDFFQRLPQRHTDPGTSERSWWVDRFAIESKNFNLKAVNPNRKGTADTRTPAELLDVIEAKGQEVASAVAKLWRLLASPS